MSQIEPGKTWRFALGLLALPLLAGCTTVAQKLAGKDRDVASDYTYEARRLTPEDVQPSTPPKRLPEIQPVQYVEQIAAQEPPLPIPLSETLGHEELLPSAEAQATEKFPVDLPTALRLAGANNLQIAFAAEQVQQALARADAADVLWVPSINAGVVYNNHAGRIQATPGEVIEASRNSLFVGAGAGTGQAPLAAGSGGPARMFVDLSLVDVLFEPLAARQVAQGARANQTATFNDTLLATALAYLDLVRAPVPRCRRGPQSGSIALLRAIGQPATEVNGSP